MAELLPEAVAGLHGVHSAVLEHGELVVHARLDAILPLMLSLRDDPRFAFEQLMDVCGVDWPERPERFDVVYNLLSVSLNHRIRVITTTDEVQAVPSVHTILAGGDVVGARGVGHVRHRLFRTA